MIFVTILLWATIGTASEIKPFVLNKCCPEGEKLNPSLSSCTGMGYDEYDDLAHISMGNFPWFPISSIVNRTTLKIHLHQTEDYLQILKENYRINPGVRPECGEHHMAEVAHFKDDLVETFHFIMSDDYSLKFYISKLGTLHDPEKDLIFFQRINFTDEYEEYENASIDFRGNFAHDFDDADSLRTFPLEDACVDLGVHNIHFLIYCPCRYTICLRKCCRDGQFLNETTSDCEKIADTFLDIPNWRPEVNGVIDQYYLLTDTFPVCETPLLLKMPIESYKKCTSFNKESDNDFMIYPNGSVKIKKYKNPYPPEKYCGEVTWHDNGKIYEQNLIVCSAGKQAQNQKYKPLKFILYGSLLLLGGVCLLITVAVSLFLPELRRRIHNKIALSHNFSLMIAYFAWGTAQLSPNLGDNSCIFLSLLIQFTFLGSFFWLNVMCIDISMTFSATRSLGGKFNSESSKKLYYYCLYSWGSTAIISVITMVMEFLPEVPFYVLRPGFTCSCGFNTETSAIFIYFYGPMAVLLVINLILFIFTTIKIMTIQRQTAILHKTESNTSGGVSYQTDKQRYDLNQWLILYAKLFLLMGLTWVSEILSWAIGGPDYYWYFSDMINLLRAVFIFILFICKKPVYLSLKRKFNGEPFSFSHKTGSSKSTTDVISITTSGRDSRFRSSTSSSKRRDTQSKMEVELQKKLSITRQTPDILSRNFNEFEESKI